jgi:polygalacturonase
MLKKLSLLSLIVCMLASLLVVVPLTASAAGTIVSYPLPSIYTTTSQYTVTADSTNIPVIDTSAVFVNYNYCNFSFSGTTTITITASETINTYNISPKALGITATKSGNTLTFTLSSPTYLIVKINNLKDLVIAADALETNVPASSGTGIYNVKTQYGADSTGASMATTAIQNAINAANAAGGGIVYVPAGVYKSGNLVLKSNVSVYLEGGSVIRGSGNPSDYTTHFHKNSLGKDGTWFIYTETNANNIKIYGRGTIDGNGHYMRNTNNYLNNILVPLQSSNFTVDGITIRDSGGWATIVTRSNNVTFQNTKHFNNNELDYENDAIDIQESQNVLIKHTVAVSEDDTYSFKTWDVATTDIAANWPGSPENQSNVVVDDALAWSRCGAFKVGDGVKQLQDGIVVKNSYVYRSWRALAVGHLYGTPAAQNIIFDNIDVEGFWPRSGVHSRWFDLSAKTGPIKNVIYNNINLRALGEISVMKGWSDTSTVSGVTLNNVRVGGVAATTLAELKITDTNSYAAAPKFNTLKFEAEGYNLSSGVISYEASTDGGLDVGGGSNGDYIAFKNVDFGSTAKTSIDLKVASANSGGRIEFHLDSPTGTMLGYWTAESTGGWQTWSVKNIPLNAGTAVGTHTVYVTFVKSDSTTVANLTWFQFK